MLDHVQPHQQMLSLRNSKALTHQLQKVQTLLVISCQQIHHSLKQGMIKLEGPAECRAEILVISGER